MSNKTDYEFNFKNSQLKSYFEKFGGNISIKDAYKSHISDRINNIINVYYIYNKIRNHHSNIQFEFENQILQQFMQGIYSKEDFLLSCTNSSKKDLQNLNLSLSEIELIDCKDWKYSHTIQGHIKRLDKSKKYEERLLKTLGHGNILPTYLNIGPELIFDIHQSELMKKILNNEIKNLNQFKKDIDIYLTNVKKEINQIYDDKYDERVVELRTIVETELDKELCRIKFLTDSTLRDVAKLFQIKISLNYELL